MNCIFGFPKDEETSRYNTSAKKKTIEKREQNNNQTKG